MLYPQSGHSSRSQDMNSFLAETRVLASGAGTNLKVGAPIRSEAPEFFLVVPFHFVALKVQYN